MKHKLLLALACALPFAASAGNFNGPYVGAHLGYVDGEDSGKELYDGIPDGYAQETAPRGPAFGLYAGFNWVLDTGLLFGVEADVEKRSVDDSSFQEYQGVPDPQYPVKTDVDSAYSLRARIGYVLNAGQTLAYGTAGYSAAKVKRTFIDAPDSVSDSNRASGWTLGAGIEHQLASNLSARAEYRLARYDESSVDTSSMWGAGTIERQEYEEQTLRVGVAYRF